VNLLTREWFQNLWLQDLTIKPTKRALDEEFQSTQQIWCIITFIFMANFRLDVIFTTIKAT